MTITNAKLHDKYNQVYKDGAYEKFFSFLPYEESNTIIYMGGNWEGKNVLEIGCGEGDLAALMAYHGATVTAIDFSEEAIELANKKFNLPNVIFQCVDYRKIQNKYDRIVMQGVLEHMDHPYETLKYIKDHLLAVDGDIISSSPSFLNIRGIIWMTLQLLFDVPMSLTDIHQLTIKDLKEYTEKLDMKLNYVSCEHDWGNGGKLIEDLRKRIPKALSDIRMSNKSEKLIEWLEKNLGDFDYNEEFLFKKPINAGAVMIYKLKNK